VLKDFLDMFKSFNLTAFLAQLRICAPRLRNASSSAEKLAIGIELLTYLA
jgi:hypothetical protein